MARAHGQGLFEQFKQSHRIGRVEDASRLTSNALEKNMDYYITL